MCSCDVMSDGPGDLVADSVFNHSSLRDDLPNLSGLLVTRAATALGLPSPRHRARTGEPIEPDAVFPWITTSLGASSHTTNGDPGVR